MRQSILLVLLFFSFKSFAQTEDVTYKEWGLLAESKTQIDISYRIIKCAASGTKQLQLQIFNESPRAQVASFDLEITNKADGSKTTKTISFSLSMGRIYTPSCSASEDGMADLKIDLPADYDPTNLSVKLTFKP